MAIRNLKTNLVQSIRAFRPADLQEEAAHLGHHFLYASLAQAHTKQEVMEVMAEQFNLPLHFGKNFDALYDCLTDPFHKMGAQQGFVVVVEHIPTNSKFDKEAREALLDTFRDVAEYWNDKKVPFRCFYSFAVAINSSITKDNANIDAERESVVTDKLLDVSPHALRMSSPFNAGYWSK